MHCNRQCVFDEKHQVADLGPTCQNCYHVAAFPRKRTRRAKKEISLDKTEGGTGSKMPALEHDVDSREGGIMLSQAGKTVVPLQKF